MRGGIIYLINKAYFNYANNYAPLYLVISFQNTGIFFAFLYFWKCIEFKLKYKTKAVTTDIHIIIKSLQLKNISVLCLRNWNWL